MGYSSEMMIEAHNASMETDEDYRDAYEQHCIDEYQARLAEADHEQYLAEADGFVLDENSGVAMFPMFIDDQAD